MSGAVLLACISEPARIACNNAPPTYAQVARDYGFNVEPAPKKQTSLSAFFSPPKLLSREEAAQESRRALEGLKMSFTLPSGLVVERCGVNGVGAMVVKDESMSYY